MATVRADQSSIGVQRKAGWLRTPWSIGKIVRRDESNWRKFNGHRKKLALSILQEELLFAGEHPVRFCVSLFILFFTILILDYALPGDWLTGSWSSWHASEQLTYFSTLWTVQATIAALVYPIVIAFVTVFLQRRPAAEALLNLYILSSGALSAGLSSVSLVLVMAIQYVLLPTYGAEALLDWVALDAAWFLINAFLTSYFLFRTIDFLRPEAQLKVIQQYCVNVALPRAVMRLNSFQVLAQVAEKGWIPGATDGQSAETSEEPTILISRLVLLDGKIKEVLQLREPSRLVDVRLWPLRIAATSWMHSAKRWARTRGSQQLQVQRRRSNGPLLNIPLVPGTEYEDSVRLARVDNGPELSRWQKLLLRHAFIFRPIRHERYGIQVKAILGELELDTREAANRTDVEAFERAYKTVVNLHELLLGASLDKSDDGTVGSWAMLPDVSNIFSRSLYFEWSDTYRSISLAAISNMASDVRPIRRICHLTRHLSGENLRASPAEIQINVMKLPTMVMYQIGKWWIRHIEEQGVIDHDPMEMAVLSPPLQGLYEEVISTFASGWEDARSDIAGVSDSTSAFDWKAASMVAQLNMEHVQETAQMLLAAVFRGDRTASEWFADVLSKWLSGLSYEHQPIVLFGKTHFLTSDHLKLDWSSLLSLIGVSEQDIERFNVDQSTMQRGIVIAAIENFWTDIRLIVVELLLSWACQTNAKRLGDSLAMEMVVGLLRGRQWRSGGMLSKPLSGFSAADYLACKVRQYAGDGKGRGGYLGFLDQFVGRVKDLERPNMVSSRTYQFSGADDVDSLIEQQLIILTALSISDWSIGEWSRRQIDIWMARQIKSVEIVRDTFRDWPNRLDNLKESSTAVLSELLRRTEKQQSVVDGLTRAKSGVASLNEFAESLWTDRLAEEQVAPQRLLQICTTASSKGFSRETGRFPLQLFNDIAFTTNDLQELVLKFSDIRKGELTQTVLERRAVNEDEFWSDTVANYVGAVVLNDMLVASKHRDVFTLDAHSYWQVLKKEAERISNQGLHPILILSNATQPEWVWQWQHADYGLGYSRPEDLRVQRLDGKGHSYICNFNEIEVFVAPSIHPGRSVLLPRELCQTITFKNFGENLPVDIESKQKSDSKHLVDLFLKFSRSVDLGDLEVIFMLLGQDTEETNV